MDAHPRGCVRRRGEADPGAGRALIRSVRGIALATALALLGCGDRRAVNDVAPADSAIPVADASGAVVRLAHRPTRVLSLIPAVTRTIVELGAADLLVGRTDFDTLTALASLPSVGGGLNPDLERMLTLRPDFVIRFEGDQDQIGRAHV